MDINTRFSALPRTVQTRQPNELEETGVNRARHTDDSNVQNPHVSQTAAAERSQEELEEIVDKMQESINVMQRNLNFSIHDSTGMTVVKVTDAGSGEVIRQMPTEDALVLAERLDEMRSLLFEARA